MDVRDLRSGQLNRKEKTVQTKTVEDRGRRRRRRAMKKDGHGMRGIVKCAKRTWVRGRW
jgi:hypothetical protein